MLDATCDQFKDAEKLRRVGPNERQKNDYTDIPYRQCSLG
jgi:hypothetical protein